MDVPAGMEQAIIDNGGDILMVDGVNGMDIGLDGSGDFAIRILVSDVDEPPDGLPDNVDDFPAIVVYGAPYAEYVVVPDGTHHDPVMGGHQIGRPTIVAGWAGTGTLGCVLRDATTNQPVAISNGHVMCGTPASPPYAAGDAINQPAPSTDPPYAMDRMGMLLRWAVPTDPAFYTVPSLSGLGGYFDAAVCSVTDRSVRVGEIEEVGTVTGFASALLGEQVYKRGSQTKRTVGTVAGVCGVYAVYQPDHSLLWWTFGQIAIRVLPDEALNPDLIWTNSGDSGSVVVNGANKIVGLHHAGDNINGYANDFPSLASALGLAL